MIELKYYLETKGMSPFAEWFDQLSDEAGACILGAVDLFHILFVDGADVPYGVNRYVTQRIVPREARPDIDT